MLKSFTCIAPGIGEESFCRQPQSRHAKTMHGREIDLNKLEHGVGLDIVRRQPAGITQLDQIDQQFITGKG
jgi:hypothetical protein